MFALLLVAPLIFLHKEIRANMQPGTLFSGCTERSATS